MRAIRSVRSGRRQQFHLRADVWRALCARPRQSARYGTLADLNNFHKLAYMAPALHSSSSIICEPMEIAVPKRHLHIIHSALKHSDKPFMGIVTSKERAEDTMAMAGIVFGEDFVRDNPVWCRSPIAIRRWYGTPPCSTR